MSVSGPFELLGEVRLERMHVNLAFGTTIPSASRYQTESGPAVLAVSKGPPSQFRYCW